MILFYYLPQCFASNNNPKMISPHFYQIYHYKNELTHLTDHFPSPANTLPLTPMIFFCLDKIDAQNLISLFWCIIIRQLLSLSNFQFKMGNNQQLLTTWSIKFIQNLDDVNFGNIDIYKNDEGQFLMSMRRTFMKAYEEKDPRLQQLQQFMQYSQSGFIQDSKISQNQQHAIITPVLHLQKSIEKNICMTYELYDIYTEYFNFTLADMIKYKKQMDSDELWLCFKWMLRMGQLFVQKKWDFRESSDYLHRIFVTLKGLPIIYFHHLKKNHHQVQPQEELEPQTLNRKSKLSRESQILLQIGIGILQLACMTQISKVENMELYLRKCSKIDQSLGSIITQIVNNLDKNPNLTLKNLLQITNELQNEKKIMLASSIRLNKFRYAIPKPEPPPKNQPQKKQSFSSSNFESKPSESPLDSRIKTLNGRKNTRKNLKDKGFHNKLYTEQNTERSSDKRSESQKNMEQTNNKKKILESLESKGLSTLNFQQKKTNYEGLFSTINKNTNKGANLLSAFKDQIAENKKKIEEEREKMNQRKQILLKNSYHSAQKQTNKQNQKQNILGNSVSQTNSSLIKIRNNYANKTGSKNNSSFKNSRNVRESFSKR